MPYTKLWTEREVSETYGFSTKTLQKWRSNGDGPGFYKIGFSVRYDPEEVAAYVAACHRNGVETG